MKITRLALMCGVAGTLALGMAGCRHDDAYDPDRSMTRDDDRMYDDRYDRDRDMDRYDSNIERDRYRDSADDYYGDRRSGIDDRYDIDTDVDYDYDRDYDMGRRIDSGSHDWDGDDYFESDIW